MDKLEKLVLLLTKLIKDNWYGKIEISIENGVIVNIKKNESIRF